MILWVSQYRLDLMTNQQFDTPMNNKKKVYVNGSIIINTRYFAPLDFGIGFSSAPEGAEVLEPTDVFEGNPCLLIDDNHPQSLFKEYYVKDDVISGYVGARYLSSSFLDCIDVYKNRITETCDVIQRVSAWDGRSQSLVYRMCFVNVLTALDAFLCFVLLKRSLHEEQLFERLMFSLAPKSKRDTWKQLKDNGHLGEWEQDAIRFVLRTSFIDTKKIDNAFKIVGLDRLVYDREELEQCFIKRHLFVHRSGIQQDDNEVIISYSLLADLINRCNSLVGTVFDSVVNLVVRELKNKQKEKDIEEIFPDGIVRIPFKASDLSRLFNGDKYRVPIEPLQLPVLS